jgi:methyltransferase (TIGR00027 family)
MLRRRFLHCMVASGLGASLANLTTGHAQSAAPDGAASHSQPTRMDEGRPSITAQSTATLRAAHQLLDRPRILHDPLALPILGTQAETSVRANPERHERLAPVRAFVAFRSRYAEDELARAVQRGVRQYVILGAGLDTFAYRSPHPGSRLRVFEVDHPATQAWKRGRLHEAGIAIPDSLTFAPIDFEQHTLADGLRRAAFQTDEPAFFSLLGVVIYLTRDAVMETLKFVASLPSGSEIVFDYARPPPVLGDSERAAHDVLARRVAAIGEPWITYFDPPSLASELRHIGFTHVEDMGPEEAHARYFANRSDGLHLGRVAHVMKAGL